MVEVPAISLTDPDMPTVSGFRGDLSFAGNQLSIRQFGGNMSGGTFNVTGNIVFTALVNPKIDVRIATKDALVMRNEAVTVRVNTNVRVAGPLAAASVTGDVGITHSKFFKQIEILPLELPGGPHQNRRPRRRPIHRSIRRRCATGSLR